MSSPLDTIVSLFSDYRSVRPLRSIPLLEWLQSDAFAPQVNRIRSTSDKRARDRLKAQLPAITPSGVFERRSAKGLIRHSGLIQIDIDEKENGQLPEYDNLPNILADFPWLAYLGRSVSGRGWWGLVPISDPSRHRDHFRALVHVFREQGIQLDRLPANVASLRGYSYDPNAYFNFRAEPFTEVRERHRPFAENPPILNWWEIRRMERFVHQIERREIDLTSDYHHWFALASAFANHFGEAGREYFHRLSQFYPDYRPAETDALFDSVSRNSYDYSLGTFYYLCQQHGIHQRPPTSRRKRRPWNRQLRFRFPRGAPEKSSSTKRRKH